MKLLVLVLALLIVGVATPRAVAGEGEHGPGAVEWGAVSWLRDVDEALTQAKEVGKPVFLLFQEVPG